MPSDYIPRHTNFYEARIWAEVLTEFDCCVDVVEYNKRYGSLNWNAYYAVCGFGHPFEEIVARRGVDGIRAIFYGTGCHPYYSNRATIAAAVRCSRKIGQWHAGGTRIVTDSWPFQLMHSDHYVVLGNEHTLSTYKDNIQKGELHSICGIAMPREKKVDLHGKEFGKAKNHLLWFGSQGVIHKGLDITLEAMQGLDGMTLHVCGLGTNDVSAYRLRQYYAETCTVVDHGFVDVGSEHFASLMKLCGAIVMPSASEGASPSVSTCMMHGGLYPLISKACGLDLPAGISFIESAEELRLALINYRMLSDEELGNYEKLVLAHAYERYGIKTYRSELQGLMKTILQ